MSSSSVSGVGKLPDMPTVNFNSRYPAGYNGVKVVPPDQKQAAQKPPPMVSASNAPLEKDGRKSTIFLLG